MKSLKDIPDEIKLEKQEYWRQNPLAFFTEALDVKEEFLWDKMEEMCISIRDNQRVSIKAGHSVSKSYTMARVVLWYLYNFAPSTVITTAPTNTQVEEILWREIREAHTNARIDLGGHLTKMQLDLQNTVPEKSVRWFAMGFSTRPDTVDGNATKMQGYHNRYILVLFDEADGIDPKIWDSVDGLITNERAKFVAIGNPMRPTGNFSDSFKSSKYHHITISVKDTPNFKEGREVIPGLSGVQYERDMAEKWGEDSDMYRSRVLGQIPDSDPDSIIPVSYYERAEGRIVDDTLKHIKRFLTVDVADGGNDDTVVKCWVNKTQVAEHRFSGKKIEEVYADIWRICKEHKGNTIVYDDDGCGRILGGLLHGVVGDAINIIAFNGSDPAYDEDFLNRRAEGYYKCYLDFKDNLISIPRNHDRAKEDLTSIRWIQGGRGGKMQVESKKDLKKRISRSTDDGDPIMMMSACYNQIEAIEKKDAWGNVGKPRRSKQDWMVA